MALKPMSHQATSVCKNCLEPYEGCKKTCQKRIREMLTTEVMQRRRKKALLALKADDYFCVDHEQRAYYRRRKKWQK